MEGIKGRQSHRRHRIVAGLPVPRGGLALRGDESVPVFKSYRLRPETVRLVGAMRKALRHEFLTFDEFFCAVFGEYLHKRRNLQARVERILTEGEQGSEEQGADGSSDGQMRSS